MVTDLAEEVDRMVKKHLDNAGMDAAIAKSPSDEAKAFIRKLDPNATIVQEPNGNLNVRAGVRTLREAGPAILCEEEYQALERGWRRLESGAGWTDAQPGDVGLVMVYRVSGQLFMACTNGPQYDFRGTEAECLRRALSNPRYTHTLDAPQVPVDGQDETQ